MLLAARGFPGTIGIFAGNAAARAVSFYYHLIKRYQIPHDMPFDEFFELFLKGKQSVHGSWDEHTGSWFGALGRKKDKFYMVRYENLRADTQAELTKISDFAGLPTNPESIAQAVELSSFENMQNIEEAQQKPARNLKDSDHSIRNIRSGRTDEFKEKMSAAQNERLWERFGRAMEQLGYKKER